MMIYSLKDVPLGNVVPNTNKQNVTGTTKKLHSVVKGSTIVKSSQYCEVKPFF